ncbi:MAG: hypothetical protein QNJ70_02920 [Xenococcaceae cyanobacterium MO_207.B15]|nr:hypothetical protein [Xenococcaceae cyanobacterium MO_207.B15]
MNKITSKKIVKIVFFDLMGEYTVLLADQLLKLDTGRILTLGRNTLPEGLFKYLNDLKGKPKLTEAVEQLKRYTLLPKALLKERETINYALQQLIERKIIRSYQAAKSLSIYDLFFTNQVKWNKVRRSTKFNQRNEIVKSVLKSANLSGNYKVLKFNPELAKKIREEIEKKLEESSAKEFKDDGDFNNHINKLKELEKSTQEVWAAGTSLDEIVEDLNDESHSSLWIIQAHNPNELREFSKRLGDTVYEKRRQNGIVDPLVSFIFDEADEFIPNRPQGSSYEASKEIVETLARRGRKFGIGIGIATQRTRYLDTSIMAQPHTYLVSKLPRESDREVVAEAFGVSKDMFRQTFKFKPGNWLLMSHDATGLKAIPVPIQTKDANKRIVENLKSLKEGEDEF